MNSSIAGEVFSFGRQMGTQARFPPD